MPSKTPVIYGCAYWLCRGCSLLVRGLQAGALAVLCFQLGMGRPDYVRPSFLRPVTDAEAQLWRIVVCFRDLSDGDDWL
jgi:hypothetical protein